MAFNKVKSQFPGSGRASGSSVHFAVKGSAFTFSKAAVQKFVGRDRDAYLKPFSIDVVFDEETGTLGFQAADLGAGEANARGLTRAAKEKELAVDQSRKRIWNGQVAAGLGGQLKTIIAKHPWVAAGFTANKSFKLVDFEAGILGAVVAAPPPAAVITPAVPAKPQAAKKAA